jgi:hypothetical protein
MAENSGSNGSQAVTLNVNESEANRNIPSSSASKTSSNGGGFCVSVPFMQKVATFSLSSSNYLFPLFFLLYFEPQLNHI